MSQIKIDQMSENEEKNNERILKLRVRNHPGVMSHICGLFSRRAYNVERIFCLPVGNGKESKIYLTVKANQGLEQIVKQLLKLEDVLDVISDTSNNDLFHKIETLIDQDWH